MPFFAAVALIPVGVVGIAQWQNAYENTRALVDNKMVVTALATAARERRPFIIAERTLRALSENDAVRLMAPECSEILAAELRSNQSYLNLVRTDGAAVVQCSALPGALGRKFSNLNLWHTAMAGETMSVGPPSIGRLTGKPIMPAIIGVKGGDGLAYGTLSASMDVSWLRRSLVAQALSPDAFVAVVGAGGDVYVASRTPIVWKFDVGMAVGRVASVRSANGSTWLYSAAPLNDRDSYIVYAEPEDTLMGAARRQMRLGLMLPLAALFVTLAAIIYGTNHLVIRWLHSLRQLADQFGRGDYSGDPEAYAKAPIEIGFVARDLHAMAQTIKSRDAELKNALAVKTNLTLEMHHRVKNNLQIVSSLLNMQASKISDPVARESLSQTRARIGALAQIHRLLYEEHDNNGRESIEISKLFDALCQQLQTLHHHQTNIRFSYHAESANLPVDMALPLTLFAVEALTNAFRHALPNNRVGCVTLYFGVDNDVGTLRITDDGIGYDTSRKFPSMGNQLMEGFAAQLAGTLVATSESGVGTEIVLTFPTNRMTAGQIS